MKKRRFGASRANKVQQLREKKLAQPSQYLR